MNRETAAAVLDLLRRAGESLAVAESITGGAVAADLVAVPGASDVLRGAVVPYATDLKVRLLGVDEELLSRVGPVHEDVARAMAVGACRVLGSVWAVATTGVAGPLASAGHPAGTVHLAVHGPVPGWKLLDLTGDRDGIRAASTTAALELLLDCVRASAATGS